MEKRGYGKEWVLFSSPQSIDRKAISILAIVETLLCVCAYWAIWIVWGVAWQHWIIIIATPMVLLRSKKSISRANGWFTSYWKSDGAPITEVKNASFCLITIFVTAVTAYYIITYTVHPTGWAENLVCITISLNISFLITFFLCVVLSIEWDLTLGLSLTLSPLSLLILFAWITVGTESPITNLILFIVLIFSIILVIPSIVALGSWVRAVLTRLASVVFHPIAGIVALPENWVREILCKDSHSAIELIPNHQDSSLDAYLEEWRVENRKKIGNVNIFSFLTFVLFLFTYYIPPLIWRFYIKSTAWFYIPLLFVGRGWVNFSDTELLIWSKSYVTKLINVVSLVIATTLLLTSITSLIIPARFIDIYGNLSDFGAPMTPLGVVFVLDWEALLSQPWQWFYLPSWLLTVAIFLLVDIEVKEIRNGSDPLNSMKKLRFFMWAGNLRAVLTNIGLSIALVYFLSAIDLIKLV